MTNLDKIDQKITDILLEHLVLANDNGQPYIQYTDVAVDKIITLIATQIQEARNKTINEVIEAIEPNQQGQWQDDGGNVAWYLDELLDRISQLRSTQ